MFSHSAQKNVQELVDRIVAVEAAVDQLRRQVESVGRQLADTPLGPVDERWQRLENRVNELAGMVAEVSSRPLAPTDPAPASAPPTQSRSPLVMSPPRFQPPGLLPRLRSPVKLDDRTYSDPSPESASREPEPAPPARWGMPEVYPETDEPRAPAERWGDDLDLGYPYATPAATPPAVVIPERTVEETLAAVARRVAESVPVEVGNMMQTSLAAIEAVAARVRIAREVKERGEIEMVLRVPADGDVESHLQEAFEREKARILGQLGGAVDTTAGLDTVMVRDIPALLDVCDTGRRQYDGSKPFYSRIEPWLRQLMSLAGLEGIEPSHGEAYNPSLHNALDLMETDDERLKDTIESCRYRGYRRHGELLKKAGVIIYR